MNRHIMIIGWMIVAILAALGLTLGCEEKSRDNPIDPNNPNFTGPIAIIEQPSANALFGEPQVWCTWHASIENAEFTYLLDFADSIDIDSPDGWSPWDLSRDTYPELVDGQYTLAVKARTLDHIEQIEPSTVSFEVDAGGVPGQVTWGQVQTSGPLPVTRACHNAIYDPHGHRMIVHGGFSSVPYNSLNDTWSFDLASETWAQITTTGSTPLNRAGYVAVYDSNRHRMVVFAGGNWWQAFYGDVWALDLATNAWAQVQTIGTGPAARLWPNGVYRPQTDELIIFGGWCGSVSDNWHGNDVWALNLATREWREVITGGDVPAPRNQSSMILDESNNRLIILGGVTPSIYFSDARALDLGTNQWASLPDYQNTVCQHRAVYIAERNLMVAVGGWGTYSHDQAIAMSTEGDQWLDLDVTGDLPSERQNLCAIWDPVGHRLIIFGGDTGGLTEDLNDTWQLMLSN